MYAVMKSSISNRKKCDIRNVVPLVAMVKKVICVIQGRSDSELDSS